MTQPVVVTSDVHDFPSTKVFGREPAVILGFIAALLNIAVAFFLPWGADTVAVVNAAISAVFFLGIAIFTRNVQLSLVLGAVQALFSVGLQFGFDVGADKQAAFMAFVNVAFALFNRQQTSPDPQPSLNLNESNNLVVTPEGEVLRGGGNEAGAVDTSLVIAAAAVVIIVCGIVWLIQST